MSSLPYPSLSTYHYFVTVRKTQIHLTEALIELNSTGTLPDEIDVIAAVSEFDGTILSASVKYHSLWVDRVTEKERERGRTERMKSKKRLS